LRKNVEARKKRAEYMDIFKRLSGENLLLTPECLDCLRKEGIVELQVEGDGSFFGFDVEKSPESPPEVWTVILRKLKENGFLKVTHGRWTNSWRNGRWSKRVVY
jgi:hypothetical protein